MYNSDNNLILKIKFAIRLIAGVVLYYTGSIKCFRYFKRTFNKDASIQILAYHDISDKAYLNLHVPAEIFSDHINYLRNNNYHIISLSEAIRLLKNNESVSHDTIVITFDDVYKSFYRTVYPIVKQYSIPITIFLCTEPLEKNYPLFIDALIYAVHNTTKNKLDLKHLGLYEYLINTHLLKERAIRDINKHSKVINSVNRGILLNEIYKQLCIDPQSPELADMVLSWDEVIDMSRNSNIEFGAHTVSHPSLSRISLSEADDEIQGSKTLIQQKINREVVLFAYPYGSYNDFNEEITELVKKTGFAGACTLYENYNQNISDLYRLGRICVTNQLNLKLLRIFSTPMFALQLSGIWDMLSFRRNRDDAIRRVDDNKIHIMYFIDQLETGAGTERHLINLVKNLDKKKFSCIVYYFEGRHGRVQEEMQANGIMVKKINLNKIYSFEAFLKAFKLFLNIRRNKIDIVQTFHFKSDTYGVLLSKISGVPKIVSSRRDTGDLKKPRQIMLNKIMNRFINRYIMVCDAVGEKVNKDESVPMGKMTTIYNGVDLQRFNMNGNNASHEVRKELGFNDDDFIVGTTAIFRPEKAYHILFEGVKKVLPYINKLRVLILGDGPMKKHFETYCQQGELADVVKFMGYIDDVKKYVQQMDIFCLVPNKNEGFSNAILEAMALGKPVIASDVGGNAESVIHNETGIIIPPDDSDELKEAILKLYNETELRLTMGKKARIRIEKRFPLEEMIKRHEDFYEETVLDGR